MRRYCGEIISILAIFILSVNLSIADTRLFVWGTIEWEGGTPAAGLEVQLVGDGNVIATNYSNMLGRYGFFNVSGNPSDYKISISLAGEKLKQITIPEDVSIGGRVPKVIVK